MRTSETTRRDALLLALAGAAGTGIPSSSALAQPVCDTSSKAGKSGVRWSQGIEGQRRGDLGNGTYRNPVLAGDQPDPSVLRDGEFYYKVSSSFEYYPGLIVWKSTDLVNWTVVGPALRQPVGSVYAPDLVKHDGRYFIYFPALNLPGMMNLSSQGKPRPMLSIFVVHAQAIEGPWSDPIEMRIFDGIDPGHAVGEDGKRYLFINDGRRVPISDDGLKRAGPTKKVYDGWRYPADWVVEGFELEGPKMLHRDGWFYMFVAQGGTGGPPTGHMVVVARSRSINGPWENCPHNPIVRTQHKSEPWWSRGHATPVQGPRGDWWLVYHGYENDFRTLGRQMLLEPFEWTKDGWPRATGGDLSKPLRKPRGAQAGPHGLALSDDFESDPVSARLQFFSPTEDYAARVKVNDGALILQATGQSPADSAPLVLNAGDRRYEVRIELELADKAVGGLLLYYNKKFFCGVGLDEKRLHPYKMGSETLYPPAGASPGRRVHLKLINDENVASFFYSLDGSQWTLCRSYEVSGYNHNVADGFLSLRPAVFAAGSGSVAYRSLRYRAL